MGKLGKIETFPFFLPSLFFLAHARRLTGEVLGQGCLPTKEYKWVWVMDELEETWVGSCLCHKYWMASGLIGLFA